MKSKYACPECAECRQVRDLRDSIKLIIGRRKNIPWPEVPEGEVDAYVETVLELKGELMRREVHETRPKRVWKTDAGRVLLTKTGDNLFLIDPFECDQFELQMLCRAIQEAVSGWGTAPFDEFRDGVLVDPPAE